MNNYHKYFNISNGYEELTLLENTVYFYGISPEERSNEYDKLKIVESVTLFEITKTDGEDTIEVGTEKRLINLRNLSEISALIESFGKANIYVDVTGLDNRVCAPLIKQCIKCFNDGKVNSVRVIYIEPHEYDIKKFRSEGEGVYFDLSEKIEGIAPLPGFIKLFPNEREVFLIALLGFEGGRFIHLIEQVECTNKNIFPVIGLPGFRLEYPHIAFWGNQKPLKDTGSWRNVKYASANSVVEVYFLLKEMKSQYPEAFFKIAPIGTKPHAIGAMIFATKFEVETELVYDNPIRKKKKTKGVGKVIECLVSELLTAE